MTRRNITSDIYALRRVLRDVWDCMLRFDNQPPHPIFELTIPCSNFAFLAQTLIRSRLGIGCAAELKKGSSPWIAEDSPVQIEVCLPPGFASSHGGGPIYFVEFFDWDYYQRTFEFCRVRGRTVENGQGLEQNLIPMTLEGLEFFACDLRGPEEAAQSVEHWRWNG